MAPCLKSQPQQTRIQEAAYAIHGLRSRFACRGALVPENPITLCFKNQTQIPVPRANAVYDQAALLQPLMAR